MPHHTHGTFYHDKYQYMYIAIGRYQHTLAVIFPMCSRCLQAYLFKYDSTHGRFDGDVEVKDGKLVIKGNTIEVFAM